jgi:hypothetical protein
MDPPSVSLDHPGSLRGVSRGLKPGRRVRLSTLLLLMVVVALLCGLYAQKRRQAQLLATLSLYRHPGTEGMFDALDQPIALTYSDDATLSDALKDIKMQTTKHPKLPKIPTGIPIYVDPVGLQEAERTLETPIKRPPLTDSLTLGEHLGRILDPLGLGYVVKDGFLLITSKESLDQLLADKVDPYPRYRDVLR